jgi:hypothetical protein
MQTEEALKIEVVAPICDNEIELEKMQVSRMETILEDFKLWKNFRDQMQNAQSHLIIVTDLCILIFL